MAEEKPTASSAGLGSALASIAESARQLHIILVDSLSHQSDSPVHDIEEIEVKGEELRNFTSRDPSSYTNNSY